MATHSGEYATTLGLVVLLVPHAPLDAYGAVILGLAPSDPSSAGARLRRESWAMAAGQLLVLAGVLVSSHPLTTSLALAPPS